MQFALLVSVFPHPSESSAYYESLLSRGSPVEKPHDLLDRCMLVLKRLKRRQSGRRARRWGGERG
jgi:hypothetical protein